MTLKTLSIQKISVKTVFSPRERPKKSIEKSLSFREWEEEKTVQEESLSPGKMRENPPSPFALPPAKSVFEFCSPRPLSELDAAALRVQKVYKSYRTRRNLADCAVVVEELWWKALDFASLKQSSVSFFNEDKPQTAVSRWARARTKAAKVGKGLSKDEKAQKLALRHWLEAIDPRHRYGHNLHIYYDIWFRSESSEPFFYWLDVGGGKDVNLEKCPRSKLQKQLIKYLGHKEREEYEVTVQDGKLVYKKSQTPVNTLEGSKWIFVLSTSRNLYVGQKVKGQFQHSSFLAGGATTSAGRLVATDGVLKAIWPYSGHYLPTEDNFNEFLNFLAQNNVDLTNVKRCSVDEDEFPSFRKEDDEAKTMELGRRLSCKWADGTGPRIGCVRDYPVDLQIKALEQVNLSPRLTSSPRRNKGPVPSPRPSLHVRVSPRLTCMGLSSPRVSPLF